MQPLKKAKLDINNTVLSDSKMTDVTNEPVVDESLESRSMLVYGVESMKKMKVANVFLSGIGGLGIEIAKNIALAGVKKLTLHDTKKANFFDLGSQFYIGDDDIGKNRAEISAPQVAELNPAVKIDTSDVDLEKNLSILDNYKCVILTDTPISLQLIVNEYCHSKGIYFVAADVKGVFCWSFTDFGENFQVLDKNGEESAEILIGNISKAKEGVVSTLNEARHDLSDGDVVKFSEIEGMCALNGTEHVVKTLTPFKFSIGDTSSFDEYKTRGSAKLIKKPVSMTFKSLKNELKTPTFDVADGARFFDPLRIIVAAQALSQWQAENNGNLPAAWNQADADKFVSIASKLKSDEVDDEDKELWKLFSFTAQGSLAPLAAFLGGVIAQECLKGLSGKFTPIKQWLAFGCQDVLPSPLPSDDEHNLFLPVQQRFDALRVCVGQNVLNKLAKANLFMIGVGAIGCEMLKNFALLNIASDEEGLVTVTDPDHIEKSNLNRQFLFRHDDIGHAKAERATIAAQRMHPAMRVKVNLDKVGAESEHIYDNKFFRKQTAVVNALDNVAARLYVDSRCVTNQRALLESGTLGPKGHVQAIVPYLTESYASQRDPPEKDVPFCTLKSFPSKLEHCIEWARDFSFGGNFVAVPETLNRLAQENNLKERLSQPNAGGLDARLVRKASKAVQRRPTTFEDCVHRARHTFDAHYRNKALNLLHTYPLDQTTDDKGTLFWSPPKRPPQPIEFDWNNPLHRQYIVHFTPLFAKTWLLSNESSEELKLANNADLARSLVAASSSSSSSSTSKTDPVQVAKLNDFYQKALATFKSTPFVPKKKAVETDESVSKDAALKKQEEEDLPDDFDEQLKQWCSTLLEDFKTHPLDKDTPPLDVAVFEKDDDSNHHVDFVAAAANLRAAMYSIEEGDRLKVKGIAGRIMPAIATTTSCVSGLVGVELIKVVAGLDKIEKYRNCFLNLAIPTFQLTEPAPAEKKKISDSLSITLWDSWELRDTPTLQNVVDYFKEKYNLSVTGVTFGAAMIYMSFLPMHKKRLTKNVRELVKLGDEPTPYVDLTIAFKDEAGNAVEGPAVRYWFP